MDVNTLFVMLHELREIIVLFDLGFLLVDGLWAIFSSFFDFGQRSDTSDESRSRMLSVSSDQ